MNIKQRGIYSVFGIGFALIGLGVWKARSFAAAHTAPQQKTVRASDTKSLAPEIAAQNDTHGTVPGNSEQTVAQMHKLYGAIQIFKQRNNGAYPGPNVTPSLVSDILAHPKDYGIATMSDANALFHNSDMQYADGASRSSHPETIWPYSLGATRPDGTNKSEPKPAGTRDVLAHTNMYFHRNIRNCKNQPSTENPVGFYLILWDDGEVQKVPYEAVRFANPKANYAGGATQTLVFPGEAGTPSQTLSYTEYQDKIYQLLVAGH